MESGKASVPTSTKKKIFFFRCADQSVENLQFIGVSFEGKMLKTVSKRGALGTSHVFRSNRDMSATEKVANIC